MTIVTFTVTNTGGQSGTYNVAINLDLTPFDLTDPILNNAASSLSATLGPGESKVIVVNLTEEAGSFVCTIKANGGDVSLANKLTWIER